LTLCKKYSPESCTKEWVIKSGEFNGVIEMCLRLAFVAMVTKISDSTSNNEI